MKPLLLLRSLWLCFLLLTIAPVARAAEPAEKPIRQITPGQVIIPTEKMRRIWGELIRLDPKTRTGQFRAESDDVVREFQIMPYAELLHHASRGDVQDYRVGERAIFRLHVNEAGDWYYLTYIQDEINFYRNHKEFLHVVAIDDKTGRITCNQGNADKSFIRIENVELATDDQTRYWKKGQPAKFSEIKVGDALQTKCHMSGKGAARICWEVFLDTESLEKFREAQEAVHLATLQDQGLPGYIDAVEGPEIQLTLFGEGEPLFAQLKPGATVKTAPAGVDRKPTHPPMVAEVISAKRQGRLMVVQLKRTGSESATFQPTQLARVWVQGS